VSRKPLRQHPNSLLLGTTTKCRGECAVAEAALDDVFIDDITFPATDSYLESIPPHSPGRRRCLLFEQLFQPTPSLRSQTLRSQSDEAIHAAVCRAMDCFAALAMTAEYCFRTQFRIPAAQNARGMLQDFPRRWREWGMPGARCARSPCALVVCTR